MADVCFIADTPDVLLDTGDAARSRIQIAKTGQFEDPRYGKFTIARSDFKRWQANFQSLNAPDTTGRLGLPVDKDHSPEKKGDTEAVGWVKSMDSLGPDGKSATPDELWATVEWNTLGKDLVQGKRYAYISPSYSHDLRDEQGHKHGTALVGVALTNRPFLQMATVSLSANLDENIALAKKTADAEPDDAPGFDPDDGDWGDQILDISDPERQAHAVIVKKIGGETKHMFPIPPGDKVHAHAALSLLPRAIKAGHITDSEAESVRARAQEVLGTSNSKQHSATGAYNREQMPELSNIAKALKLDESTDEKAILDAIASLAKPTPEGTVTLSQEQVDSLVSDASAGREALTALSDMKFETAFDKALEAGKTTPALKDTMKAIYDQSPEHAVKLLDEAPAAVSMVPLGSGAGAAGVAPELATLAKDFQETVTPMGIDQDALKLHAAACELEVARKIPYEDAVRLAEQGVRA